MLGNRRLKKQLGVEERWDLEKNATGILDWILSVADLRGLRFFGPVWNHTNISSGQIQWSFFIMHMNCLVVPVFA